MSILFCAIRSLGAPDSVLDSMSYDKVLLSQHRFIPGGVEHLSKKTGSVRINPDISSRNGSMESPTGQACQSWLFEAEPLTECEEQLCQKEAL
jgi:hypothetical protein